MPKSRGQAVDGLWAVLVQLGTYAHAVAARKNGWVQTGGFIPKLSNFCTQLLGWVVDCLTTVGGRLYTFCTGPITTTTIKLRSY